MFDILSVFDKFTTIIKIAALKKSRIAVFTLLVALLVVVYINYPKLNLISGVASKNMASQVFLANRVPDSVVSYDNNMPLVKLADAELLKKDSAAVASVYGLMKRKAVYKEGVGAALTNDTYDAHTFSITPERVYPKDTIPFPYGNAGVTDTVFDNVDYEVLEQALDNAFAKPSEQKTRTVLVAYKNHIIGERYLDGFSKDSPMLPI